MPFDPLSLDLLPWAVALFAGGLIKGLVGFGLPLIAVPAMSLFLPLPFAVTSMVGPILATNLLQIFRAGRPWPLVRRFWPLLFFLGVGILAGSHLLANLGPTLLYRIIGTIVVAFALVNLFGLRFAIAPGWEARLAVPFGLVAGLCGGLGGIWGPPLIIYLTGLHLSPTVFVAVLGLLFTAGNLVLGTSLVAVGLMGWSEAAYTLAAIVPAMAGMLIGQRFSDRVQPATFRRMVLVTLTVLGISLLFR